MRDSRITSYYDATEFREIREDLVFALKNVIETNVAIDCGCGAGADITYLIEKGFTVYGFDIEEESISRCRSRFGDRDDVILSRSSFSTFDYPQASLLVADASLFFCPRLEFKNVWRKISECLSPDGIFCGSFLGPEDTMANPNEHDSVFWPDITVFEESDVRALFEKFEVLRFKVHRSTGKAPNGAAHHWHIFQVVAQKAC